jgi:acyl-CoA reductase-like NAD-dependent aldehyde dehydrogenase
MKYVSPGHLDSIVSVQPRYENFIGGKWLAPTMGKYRVNLSPATAKPICEVADSTFRAGRAIKTGRVWTNFYHQYPAGAAFGGYKISGIGRETHKMMLEHYSQTKNLLVSYSTKPLGLF